jgi:hypothetical protein
MVEKMDRKWQDPATSSGHGAGMGRRKRQGRRGAAARSLKALQWGGGSGKDKGGAGRRCAPAAAWFVQMKTKGEGGMVIFFTYS